MTRDSSDLSNAVGGVELPAAAGRMAIRQFVCPCGVTSNEASLSAHVGEHRFFFLLLSILTTAVLISLRSLQEVEKGCGVFKALKKRWRSGLRVCELMTHSQFCVTRY